MKKFTFIDLFCGLGGFRLALEQLGGHCLFSSEINPHACQIYKTNFGDDPFCDITTLDPSTLPDFDILCAGFPCQAFSIAGKKKGFDDIRGTLFFDVCRVIKEKKPKFVLLENVKHLTKHDNGHTFNTILSHLTELNYTVSYQILNAKDFGVPQSRERIVMVAVNNNYSRKKFIFNQPNLPKTVLADILNKSNKKNNKKITQTDNKIVDPNEYTLIPTEKIKQQKSGLIFCGYRNKNIRKIGVKENTYHLSRTHKQPNRIYHSSGTHPTLSSQETSGRYFVQHNNQVIQLTIDNCFQLMGFPTTYKKIGSESHLYNRIGNSVCVPMVYHTLQSMIEQYHELLINNQ